jgi:phytoene synthase
MTTEPVDLRCSSQHAAFGDDTAKDADNLRFLSGRDPADVDAWMRRVVWLREADRLAENQRMFPSARRFTEYAAQRRSTWIDDDANGRQAWGRYLDALETYTCTTFSIETLADHDAMLGRISGNMFQTFPFLDERARSAIYAFGALDQFWNNLRDVDEDAAGGICYFPTVLLWAFDLRPTDVLDGSARGRPAWGRFMKFWLGVYLPRLEESARPFMEMTGLHPSIAALRACCLDRYERVKAAVAAPVRFFMPS